jgi:hypothetical protein
MTSDAAIELIVEKLRDSTDLMDLLTEGVYAFRLPEQPDEGFYSRVVARELSVGPVAYLHGRRALTVQVMAETGGLDKPDRLLASIQKEVNRAIHKMPLGDAEVYRTRYPTAPLYDDTDSTYSTTQLFTITLA